MKILPIILVFLAPISFSQTNTFVDKPVQNQVYQRNSSNQCYVGFSGNTTYNDIIIKRYKKSEFATSYVLENITSATVLTSGAWQYQYPITSELSEWRFEVYGFDGSTETIIDTFDNLLCGEIIVVMGQSNATSWDYAGALDNHCNGSIDDRFTRAYGRGLEYEQGADPLQWNGWGKSSAAYPTNDYFAGAWPLIIQNEITDYENIPTGVINAAVPSTSIADNQPGGMLLSNTNNTFTIYTAAMAKLEHAGVKNSVKSIFWYQGEREVSSGINCQKDYVDAFMDLRLSWYNDLPSLNKIFLFQLNCACNEGHNNSTNHKSIMRDAQLILSESLSDVQLISTFGVTDLDVHNFTFNYEPCHFTPQGKCKLASRTYPLYKEYITNSINTAGDSYPPVLQAAVYNDQNNSIRFYFDKNIQVFDNNTTDSYFLKDYFYDENGIPISSYTDGINLNYYDLILNVGQPVPSSITYLPNSVYNDASTYAENKQAIYFGPCIMSLGDMPSPSYYKFPVISTQEYVNGWTKSWDFYTSNSINTCSFNFNTHDNSLYKTIEIGGCSNTQHAGNYTWLKATDYVELNGDFTVNTGADFTILIENISTLCE